MKGSINSPSLERNRFSSAFVLLTCFNNSEFSFFNLANSAFS